MLGRNSLVRFGNGNFILKGILGGSVPDQCTKLVPEKTQCVTGMLSRQESREGFPLPNIGHRPDIQGLQSSEYPFKAWTPISDLSGPSSCMRRKS